MTGHPLQEGTGAWRPIRKWWSLSFLLTQLCPGNEGTASEKAPCFQKGQGSNPADCFLIYVHDAQCKRARSWDLLKPRSASLPGSHSGALTVVFQAAIDDTEEGLGLVVQ